MSVLQSIASYSEANKNNYRVIDGPSISKVGQMFQAPQDFSMESCRFYLSKFGSPTGNATAKIYLSSTQDGTAGVPTGSALGTSDNFDVSTLNSDPTFALQYFTFSTQVSLTGGSYYFLTFEYSNGDGSNNIEVGSASPTTNGRSAFYDVGGATWTSSNTSRLVFYVYGYPVQDTSGSSSFLVSEKISEMQLELNILGQAMEEDDFILFLNKANEYIQTGYKIPTTERETDLLLFKGVNEYPLPYDFQGIIEPKRPYGMYSPNFQHETVREFVHWPYGRITGFKFDKENQFLVANEPDGDQIALQDCESLTDNGTWAISGDGSDLVIDTQIFTEGDASLRFSIAGSGGSTTLACTGMTSVVDITNYLTQGWLFLDLQCPSTNITAISSISIKIGSDSSNYYQMSSNSRYRGDTILGGWGLIGFDLSQKITFGTPDEENIDYIQIVITHGTSGINGIYRLDNIFLANAIYYQLPYYSQYNIKADDGTYKAAITETGDTVLCPNGGEFSSVYTYKALEIANAMRFKDAAVASYCARELEPREKYLKALYPSQESRPSVTWYKRNRFRTARGIWPRS